MRARYFRDMKNAETVMMHKILNKFLSGRAQYKNTQLWASISESNEESAPYSLTVF